MIKINNLYKTYYTKEREIDAISNINLEVKENDFIAIVGPSGCGKSTLLSIIGDLDKPTKGEIIKKDNLKIGYMFQDDCLFPWLTIYENCTLGLKITKTYTKENIDNVISLLDKYDLKEFMNSYPKEISGGMKQRVALIRTLALKPDLLLLDEPFSRLDSQMRINVSNDVLNIIKNENKTLIMVTHDINEAIRLCNKVVVLSKRPSKVKNIYTIDNDDYYDKIWEDLNEE